MASLSNTPSLSTAVLKYYKGIPSTNINTSINSGEAPTSYSLHLLLLQKELDSQNNRHIMLVIPKTIVDNSDNKHLHGRFEECIKFTYFSIENDRTLCQSKQELL